MHSKGGDGFLQVTFKILQLCVCVCFSCCGFEDVCILANTHVKTLLPMHAARNQCAQPARNGFRKSQTFNNLLKNKRNSVMNQAELEKDGYVYDVTVHSTQTKGIPFSS